MAKCAGCGTTILIGGVRDGESRYCKETCQQNFLLTEVIRQIPPDVLESRVYEVHQGDCPKCGRPGPVDVHTSHTIWSFIYLTTWRSRPQICCRRCGMKAKLGAATLCGIFGWWGIPWGLLGTPIQIGRNLWGAVRSPSPTSPSATLCDAVRVDVANQILEGSRRRMAETSQSANGGAAV